jgi:undecaprenyl-diphosphatase
MLIAAALCFVAFVALTALVMKDTAHVRRFDERVEHFFAPLHTPAWSAFWNVVTFLGSFAIIVLFSLLFAAAGRFDLALLIRGGIAVLGSAIVVQAIKLILARERPAGLAWLPEEPEWSYPSGHAAAALSLYGFLAVLLSGVEAPLITLSVLVVILFVGISRVALSVHYASDVIGGFLAGAFFLLLSFSVPIPF